MSAVFAEMSDSQFVSMWPTLSDPERSAAPAGFERYRRVMGSIGRGLQGGTQHGEPSALVYAPSDEGAREPWPAPQPLTARISAEPYPAGALPATIRAAINEVAGFVQAPIPLVANSAVAALSAAAQGHVDVRRAERLQGPTSVYMMAVADSGERKSTCDSFFTATIRDYEKAQAEAAVPVLQRYNGALAAWTAEREGILQAIKQAAKTAKPVERLRADLVEHEQHKPEAPRIPRLIYGDATPEALTYSLATRWPSGAVVSSEAGSILGAHGMSGDSIMRNLAILNELWDGKPLSFERRSTESYAVRGARLTVGLAIQSATLREFFGKSGALARGSGFLARFLICAPESTQGTRHFSEAPKSWPALAVFNRRIAEILNQPVAMDDAALTPSVLELSTEAKTAWITFHDAIESSLSQGGELHDVRDVASKAADNAARLAGLFHVFDSGDGAISLEAFAGAARIVAWHLSESRRFFGELAVPIEIANAHKLNDWLIDYCRRKRVGDVSTKAVQHRGPSPLRDRAALQAALAELEELGRIRVVTVGKRRLIEVNPELLTAGGSDGAC
jgi:putative DNA primase/helicase